MSSAGSIQALLLQATIPDSLDTCIFHLLCTFTFDKIIWLLHTYDATPDPGTNEGISA
jgi:hypothetical protein